MVDEEKAEEVLDVGLRLLRTWDYGGAIRAFTEALSLNPDLVEAYEKRAFAFRRLGREREADRDIATSRVVLRNGLN
jgi:Flp pilus assembly protein TadD